MTWKELALYLFEKMEEDYYFSSLKKMLKNETDISQRMLNILEGEQSE